MEAQAVVGIVVALLTALGGFFGGRLSKRKLAAEVTLAEVNAYEARITGLSDLATSLARSSDELRGEVMRLDTLVGTLRAEMTAQRDFYARHDAELHTSLAKEFEQLASEHRKHATRFDGLPAAENNPGR